MTEQYSFPCVVTCMLPVRRVMMDDAASREWDENVIKTERSTILWRCAHRDAFIFVIVNHRAYFPCDWVPTGLYHYATTGTLYPAFHSERTDDIVLVVVVVVAGGVFLHYSAVGILLWWASLLIFCFVRCTRSFDTHVINWLVVALLSTNIAD